MSAIITSDYRVFNVDSFIKSMEGTTPVNYLYLFIGNSTQWIDSANAESVNDTSPPQPIDCLNDVNFIWRNMLSLKRVLRSDVSSGVKKRSWTYGVYYDIYRHDYGVTGVNGVSETGTITTPDSLLNANYYVVTDIGNVYICIGNNNGANPSTDNPQNYGTGIGFGVFTTNDGYKWKYISAVSPTDYSKFSTLDFHPVKTLVTQPTIGDPYEEQYLAQTYSATTGGAIYNILVSSGGTSGYASTTIGTISDQSAITIKGDGSGLKIAANINSSGAIASITVLEPGVNYTYCYISVTGVSNSILKPIYTPRHGLGADPIKDLCANYMLVNSRLTQAEGDGDFTVLNDYRQIGLVVNPLYRTGARADQASLDASIKLTMTTTANFLADSEITNDINNTRARIIDWAGDTKILRVNLPQPSDSTNWTTYAGFAVGQTISQVGGTGATQNNVISAVEQPEISPYTGQILYFENRRPIQRDISQIEDLHIAIEY